jgi:DUF1680 family protein
MDGRWKSQSAIVEARSYLATEGKVRINVDNVMGAAGSLVVRKPDWAQAVILTRNGTRLDGLRVPQIATGDVIVAQYKMDFRVESADGVQSRPGRKALYFGPWLLGASSHDQPEYFNELFADNQVVPGSRRAPYFAHPLPFAVPVAAHACACIPAEFPGEAMKVDLRAVAEQTGYDPARWQTAFVVKEST